MSHRGDYIAYNNIFDILNELDKLYISAFNNQDNPDEINKLIDFLQIYKLNKESNSLQLIRVINNLIKGNSKRLCRNAKKYSDLFQALQTGDIIGFDNFVHMKYKNTYLYFPSVVADILYDYKIQCQQNIQKTYRTQKNTAGKFKKRKAKKTKKQKRKKH